MASQRADEPDLGRLMANEVPGATEPEGVPSIPDHEMFREIGRGAYGEVWLGRNVVGTCRAVKIVYRDRFKDALPYEREFNGIQKYEPLSRSQPGLVNILQIGRNDVQGYFYYVMELADDASVDPERKAESEISSSSEPPTESSYVSDIGDLESYVPRTLSQVLRTRQRLSAGECLELGLTLTRSIGFLHDNQLLHRDIKPSNIIFIRGIPKLADIGLLADVSEAQSFVGTEGYIAPEGPNSVRGDIFSLGKVLYEASVGKDRLNFPEPITNIGELPDSERLLECNAVIVRACEHDFKNRYPTMDAMRVDLELIQGGKSVKRRRILARRWSLAWKSAVLVMFLVIALGGYWSEDDPVQPFNLTTARFQIDNASFWTTESSPRRFDFSPDGTQVVFAPPGGGLSMWHETTRIIRDLELPEAVGWRFAAPRWSPDGRLIAVIATRYDDSGDGDTIQYNAICILDPADGSLRQIEEEWPVGEGRSRLCWGPGKEELTLVHKTQAFRVTLDGRKAHWREFNVPSLGHLGGYSPDGRWLVFDAARRSQARGEDRDLWVLSSSGGMARQLTFGQGFDGYPTWESEGMTIAYVSADGSREDASRNLWRMRIDAKSGDRLGAPQQLTFDKGQKMFHPKFLADGDRMVCVGVRKQSTIWVEDEARESESEATILGDWPTLSPEGDTVYYLGSSREQSGIYAFGREAEKVRQITEMVPIDSGLDVLGPS